MSRFPNPPRGLVLCGGDGWDSLSDAAREEILLMDQYLCAGGKKVYGSFNNYRETQEAIAYFKQKYPPPVPSPEGGSK